MQLTGICNIRQLRAGFPKCAGGVGPGTLGWYPLNARGGDPGISDIAYPGKLHIPIDTGIGDLLAV